MQIMEPFDTGFTIYSKSGCSNCTKVKNLLLEKQFFFVDISCDEFLIEDKEQFLLFIKERAKKEYKIFPMVFKDAKFIGGFIDTQTYLNQELSFDENENF
jgi:glutaredoxin